MIKESVGCQYRGYGTGSNSRWWSNDELAQQSGFFGKEGETVRCVRYSDCFSPIDLGCGMVSGRPLSKNINVGANLKVINRRFSLNRIPVVEYDEIIDNV